MTILGIFQKNNFENTNLNLQDDSVNLLIKIGFVEILSDFYKKFLKNIFLFYF